MALNEQLQALQKRIDTLEEIIDADEEEEESFDLPSRLASRGAALMGRAGYTCEADINVLRGVTRMANLVDELLLLEEDHPLIKRYEEFWDGVDEYDWEDEISASVWSHLHGVGQEEPKSAEAFITGLLDSLEAEQKDQIKEKEKMPNRKKRDRQVKKIIHKEQKTKTRINARKKAKKKK